MARRERRKSKPSKTYHSQRMNQLKAKALSQVAQQAWNVNLRYKTIPLLNEALRRDPNNVDTLLQLAAAYGKQRFYDDAEKYLLRVLELAPRKAAIHRRVAATYAGIDRPERAVECYRRSLELNRDTDAAVPTLLELAGLYERRHQLDDAIAVVEEALARVPGNEQAILQQALLERRRGKADRAESTLRTLVGDERHTWPIRAQAWYELAQLLDSQDRFDDAYQALLSAKQLMAPHAAPFRRQNRDTVDRNREMLQSLSVEHFDRWRKLAEHDTPYQIAVLTSHPRSGTTLVEQMLDSHDDLKSADEFDVYSQWIHQPIVRKFPSATPLLELLDHVPPAVRQQARATYWRQTEAIFDEDIGSRMLLDKNPGMTIMLPLVNWAFPEVKMLIALRDPRDVILSCFMQKVPLTPIGSNWLRLSDAADYYASAMNTWLAVRRLSASNWMEFRYEDVVVDLELQARRILEFLGLPWDDKVLRFYEHAREKVVRSPTYKDVTEPVYQRSVGRWQHYARHFAPLESTLAPFLKEFGYV